MKTPLSDWTAQQFVESVAALGMNYKAMAAALGKRHPTISAYSTGRNPIPQSVAIKINGMLTDKRDSLAIILGTGQASIGQLINYHNEHKVPALHRTDKRFMRRQGTPDLRTYPLYRLRPDRYQTYLMALSTWAKHVRTLALEHTDEARQRDYALELADIRAMAAAAPRNAPYDVCITRVEWDVVSRALRHVGTKPALALVCHWRRHKGAGYPRNRLTTQE